MLHRCWSGKISLSEFDEVANVQVFDWSLNEFFDSLQSFRVRPVNSDRLHYRLAQVLQCLFHSNQLIDWENWITMTNGTMWWNLASKILFTMTYVHRIFTISFHFIVDILFRLNAVRHLMIFMNTIQLLHHAFASPKWINVNFSIDISWRFIEWLLELIIMSAIVLIEFVRSTAELKIFICIFSVTSLFKSYNSKVGMKILIQFKLKKQFKFF